MFSTAYHFSLSESGHNLLSQPEQQTRLALRACWQTQRGWAGERPGLIIDWREAVAQEAKQETNGSTDGLLQMHPWGWQSSRPHAEWEWKRQTQTERGEIGAPTEELFLFFFSRGSSSLSVITKGQQLLQPSRGCMEESEREREGGETWLSQNNPHLQNGSHFTKCMSVGLRNVRRLACENGLCTTVRLIEKIL